MSKFFLLAVSQMLCLAMSAQWDQYMAEWEGTPGRMMVNMVIHDQAPVEQLPYLLELSIAHTSDCNTEAQEALLDQIEEHATFVDSALSALRYVEDVGRFLYVCEAKAYLYVEDTIAIREVIPAEVYYKLIADPSWNVYKKFIYPDDYLQQTMLNDDVILALQKDSIDLSGKLELTHQAAFSSADERGNYKRFLQGQNFTIVKEESLSDSAHPYTISFSRRDKLDLQKLSNITLRLHQKAEYLDGVYGGWGLSLDGGW